MRRRDDFARTPAAEGLRRLHSSQNLVIRDQYHLGLGRERGAHKSIGSIRREYLAPHPNGPVVESRRENKTFRATPNRPIAPHVTIVIAHSSLMVISEEQRSVKIDDIT